MLSETKQQVQDLINKVQVLDFVLNTLNLAHKDCANQVEINFLRASKHKMKLLEEILRLSNASEVTIVEPQAVIEVPTTPLTVA